LEVVVSALALSTTALNGHDLAYVDSGSGPTLVFVHGLLGSHQHWAQLMAEIGPQRRVVAPDLLGHGGSAKPMGDYSLGAHAATVRDLLDRLGIGSVTMVGHSLGGGIAMQFAYLFPGRVERLVLVSSGGLGREVGLPLRAATLPGAELVLPLLASRWVRDRGEAVARQLTRVGVHAGPDLLEAWASLASLREHGSRRAFLGTARAVIDPGGQTVSASSRLPLVGNVPTLIVWGARDRMIPPWHGVVAAQSIPGCRVEIFEEAGHFPHLEDPERFSRVLREFAASASS
jgi:pimeloyl-ACP methyl ester carboxylesterase